MTGPAAGSEEWRPVPGWPGYDVSSLGRVRSVPRILGDGRTAGGVVLAQHRDGKGYARVTLSRGARSSVKRVHNLVALAFLGPRPRGMQVLHRNDDHSRNDIGSLRYGTPERNVRERTRRERRQKMKRGRVRKVESGSTAPGSGAAP